MGTSVRRIGGVLRSPVSLLVVALLVFLAGRLRFAFGAQVFTSFDTFSYAYRGVPELDRGALVSLTGHAPRTWGVPLFFALFPNDHARALGQWAVGTVAWALLAVTLWTCLRHLAARLVAVAGTLILGLLPQVANWDFAILSESLSISLGVIVLALLIWWFNTKSPWLLGAMSIIAVWWLFVRPEILLLAGLIAVVLAVRAWRHRRWTAAVAAGVLLGAVAWAILITPTVGRTFAGWSATQLSLEEETLTCRLRLQVLPDPQIKAVYQNDLGMPACPPAERIAAGTEWNLVEFAEAYKNCPALKAWGERNATSSGYRFAVAAPDLYAGYIWHVLPESLGGTGLATLPRAVPDLVQHAFFPPYRVVVPLLFGGFAVLLAAAVVTGALRRHRRLVVAAILLMAAGIGSIVAGLIYSAGTYNRYGIQEAIGMRIAVLFLAVAVLDAILERRREHRQASGQEPIAEEHPPGPTDSAEAETSVIR